MVVDTRRRQTTPTVKSKTVNGTSRDGANGSRFVTLSELMIGDSLNGEPTIIHHMPTLGALLVRTMIGFICLNVLQQFKHVCFSVRSRTLASNPDKHLKVSSSGNAGKVMVLMVSR
ncbi:hypothetical protein V6N13_006079 [Hibiscus sabdariffa]|uniref:Uncharacterized protein n=1 Tax=Hibiscus sabdariffa TaxID=183260 RepID=A0ABR2EP88_9ROSI